MHSEAQVDSSERDLVIQSVCDAHSIQRWGVYTEDQAATFMGKDPSTIKRWRRKGLIPFKPDGPRGVRYLGWMIAQMIAYGVSDRAASLPSTIRQPSNLVQAI